MATALIAMNHFNERNPTIVPQLSEYTQNCSYKFDTTTQDSGGGGSYIIDSQLVGGHQTVGTEILKKLVQTKRPCAIVGPYTDDAARAVSNLAWSIGVPLVRTLLNFTLFFGQLILASLTLSYCFHK